MQKVLVAGGAGGIGSRLRKLLDRVYPDVRCIRKPADLASHQTFVQADLGDLRSKNFVRKNML